MIKNLAIAFIISICAATLASAAEPVKTAAVASHSVSPAGAAGKSWESLTKAEKIKLIEQKRVERIKKSEAKWKGMTDDQKIAQYETRRKRGQDMWAKRDANASAAATPVATAKH